MNINRKQTMQLTGILISVLLLCSCSAQPKPAISKTIAPTLTQPPGIWQMVGVYNTEYSIMTAGFLDEQHVATGGVGGRMAYSSDGANAWLQTDAAADCRYGIEIVSPKVIWTCGGATNVRKSVDGGKTWQVLAAFGNPRTITNPCHSMSFLDENTGWLANSNLFGTTTDGGASWQMQALPAAANQVATIDMYQPGKGYLLDQNGVLFFTKDNGIHWREASRLNMDGLKMSNSVYQLAAMRFSDADHGLIVISSGDSGKKEPVVAFRTSDDGQHWVSEPISVPAGPVYLSRVGEFLTVISSVNQLTLLRYAK